MKMIKPAEKPAEKEYWWRDDKEPKSTCAIRHQPGYTCPECGKGVLAYDGLFILTCSACGYIAESGAFT
jgi:ribosomal protein L37AE/L43A